MTATAVLYRELTNIACGTLTIVQNDNASPVLITGLISQLNASSAHVCSIEKSEKNSSINYHFRVFMFIQFLSLKLFQIVQQLLVILILTVNH